MRLPLMLAWQRLRCLLLVLHPSSQSLCLSVSPFRSSWRFGVDGGTAWGNFRWTNEIKSNFASQSDFAGVTMDDDEEEKKNNLTERQWRMIHEGEVHTTSRVRSVFYDVLWRRQETRSTDTEERRERKIRQKRWGENLHRTPEDKERRSRRTRRRSLTEKMKSKKEKEWKRRRMSSCVAGT